MPIVGRIFGGLDFSNYFVVLAPPPPSYTGPMTYEALTKAGVPLFAYGNFITVLLNFLILAFIIFLMIRQINRLRRDPAAAPATARRHRPAARDPRLAAPLSPRPARATRVARLPERDAVPGRGPIFGPILGESSPVLEDFCRPSRPPTQR